MQFKNEKKGNILLSVWRQSLAPDLESQRDQWGSEALIATLDGFDVKIPSPAFLSFRILTQFQIIRLMRIHIESIEYWKFWRAHGWIQIWIGSNSILQVVLTKFGDMFRFRFLQLNSAKSLPRRELLTTTAISDKGSNYTWTGQSYAKLLQSFQPPWRPTQHSLASVVSYRIPLVTAFASYDILCE
jgi:hypothetical protein